MLGATGVGWGAGGLDEALGWAARVWPSAAGARAVRRVGRAAIQAARAARLAAPRGCSNRGKSADPCITSVPVPPRRGDQI